MNAEREGFYNMFLEEKKTVDSLIQREFQRSGRAYYPRLSEAMEYALFSGGKRIRPVVLKWCSELGSPDEPVISKCVSAIEYVHAYSLIHDDLPSMDDDGMRRGKPTVHVVYGEALAILAGDALLTEAFTLLGRTGKAKLTEVLAFNAGAAGMVGGQAADILKSEDIEYINELKTACLFRAAAVMGGVAADLDDALLDKLSVYGVNLGKAFQLRDDVLDSEAPDASKALDKALGYVKVAREAVSGLKNSEKLLAVADFMVNRKK